MARSNKLCPDTFLPEVTELKQCLNSIEGLRRSTVRAQCMNVLKNMRAIRCLSTPPAQIVKYSFKSRFRSPEAGSRSKSVSVTVEVFRSEDLENSSFTIFLMMGLNHVHLASRSNLATTIWNSVVVWK